MPLYALNLTQHGANLAGQDIQIEAENIREAITFAEKANPGRKVIRGSRIDGVYAPTEAETEAWMERHRKH